MMMPYNYYHHRAFNRHDYIIYIYIYTLFPYIYSISMKPSFSLAKPSWSPFNGAASAPSAQGWLGAARPALGGKRSGGYEITEFHFRTGPLLGSSYYPS